VTVLAYTYEADHHCPECAFARFGQDEHGSVPEDAVDGENNPIGAVFPWDEWWEPSIDDPQTLVCSDCGAELDEVEGEPEE